MRQRHVELVKLAVDTQYPPGESRLADANWPLI
jgi:hypothetical protein